MANTGAKLVGFNLRRREHAALLVRALQGVDFTVNEETISARFGERTITAPSQPTGTNEFQWLGDRFANWNVTLLRTVIARPSWFPQGGTDLSCGDDLEAFPKLDFTNRAQVLTVVRSLSDGDSESLFDKLAPAEVISRLLALVVNSPEKWAGPPAAAPVKCCERDTDGDGDCPIHPPIAAPAPVDPYPFDCDDTGASD